MDNPKDFCSGAVLKYSPTWGSGLATARDVAMMDVRNSIEGSTARGRDALLKYAWGEAPAPVVVEPSTFLLI